MTIIAAIRVLIVSFFTITSFCNVLLAMSLEEQVDESLARTDTSAVGQLGEALAAKYLLENGYRLVMTNFKVPIGRNTNGAQVTGEIDIIAFDGETLCYIEVKTRSSSEFAGPLAAVTLRKQRQITRTARVYRRTFGISDIEQRFDVVTILMDEPPQIELIKGFWSESRFKKKQWSGDIWDGLSTA